VRWPDERKAVEIGDAVISNAKIRERLGWGPTFSLEEILRDRFGSLTAPAISGVSFGHIEQKLVLPIGAQATLDADAGTLRVDEAAVT